LIISYESQTMNGYIINFDGHNFNKEYSVKHGNYSSLRVCPARWTCIGQTHHVGGQRSFGLGLSVYPLWFFRPTVLPRPLLVLSEARRDLPQSLLYPRTITLASAYRLWTNLFREDIGRNIRIFRNPGDSGRRLSETHPIKGGSYCQNI